MSRKKEREIFVEKEGERVVCRERRRELYLYRKKERERGEQEKLVGVFKTREKEREKFDEKALFLKGSS